MKRRTKPAIPLKRQKIDRKLGLLLTAQCPYSHARQHEVSIGAKKFMTFKRDLSFFVADLIARKRGMSTASCQ